MKKEKKKKGCFAIRSGINCGRFRQKCNKQSAPAKSGIPNRGKGSLIYHESHESPLISLKVGKKKSPSCAFFFSEELGAIFFFFFFGF